MGLLKTSSHGILTSRMDCCIFVGTINRNQIQNLMKSFYKVICLTLLLGGVSMALHANKWRVNNVVGLYASFTSPQIAHDATEVLAGDTLYIEGSAASYGDLTLTKSLVLIGPGYFLAENDSTQANWLSATLSSLTVSTGAENSVITGITVSNSTYLQCNNLLLKRNYLNAVFIGGTGIGSNIFLQQSYLNSLRVYTGSQNLNISNNFFSSYSVWDYCLQMDDGSSGIVNNNIFNSNVYVYNSEIRNNIHTSNASSSSQGFFYYGTCVVSNNISAGPIQPCGGNGNQCYVDMSTVFLYAGSSDGQFMLKPGSPAIGAGYGGVDCGIFGGIDPYVLSGIPTVPAIWLLDVNGSSVSLKALSH